MRAKMIILNPVSIYHMACNDYMILIIDFHALCVCVCVISLVKLDKEIETV